MEESLKQYLVPSSDIDANDVDDLPVDNDNWDMEEAVRAMRERGYLGDFPSWMTSAQLSPEDVKSSLSMMYYFVNQMERSDATPHLKTSLRSDSEDEEIEASAVDNDQYYGSSQAGLPNVGFDISNLDSEASLSRAIADRDHLLNQRAALHEQLIHARNENISLVKRIQGMEAMNNEANKVLLNEKEFLKRQVSDFKQRETQHQHEIRRLELEMESLREKLRGYMASGAKVNKSAITSSPTISSSTERTSSASILSMPDSASSSTQASFSKNISNDNQIRIMKSKIDELTRENQQLRVLMQAMTQQIDALLGGDSSPDSSSKASKTSKASSLASQINLNEWNTLIQKQLEELKLKASEWSIAVSEDFDQKTSQGAREIEQLRHTIQEQSILIQQQHQLLKLAVSPDPVAFLTQEGSNNVENTESNINDA